MARDASARDRYSKMEVILASREPSETTAFGQKRKLTVDLETLQGDDEEVTRLSNMCIEDLRKELDAASAQLKTIFRYLRNTDEAIEKLSLERQSLQRQRLLLRQEPSRTCIVARNNFSKPRIAQQFAERIRLQDAKEVSIDPAEPRRDYAELRGEVKVFCVSSKAYQQLSTTHQRSFFDTPVKGYLDVYDTEIPQLVKHCLEFTVGRRRLACETFLNRLAGLLNSLEIRAPLTKLWEDISDDKKSADRKFLKERHDQLQKVCSLLGHDRAFAVYTDGDTAGYRRPCVGDFR